MFQIYIMIGLVYGFILTWGAEHLIKHGEDESVRFTFIEILLAILLWPIYLGLFLYRLIEQK